jgi:Beta-propeller repeat
VGRGIAVDSSGNAYVTGETDSTNFPTMNPLQPALSGNGDAFVAKLNPTGSALVYSTYLGSGGDTGLGIAVDSSGNAYVTGLTYSTNFPTMNPLQPAFSGKGDAFVAKIASIGSDNTPPITTANPSPGPNINGWNNTNVTINLNATDNPGGSGVKQIEFALGGAQNTGWQTVAGNTASVTISAEGATTLSYFATDNAGNLESAKTLTVRIDKTPPIISGLPAPGCTIWPPNHKLVQVATVIAADALSGFAPGSFNVTGKSNDPAKGQIVITGGPSQFVVQLGADKDQIYTLTATASDLAGNTITKQATCTVPHDQGK